MKSLLCVAALLAMIQPALAGPSCWSAENGNRLLFPPVRMAVTYSHAGLVEPCDVSKLDDHQPWRVWCDVSSISGVVQFVRAHHAHRGPVAAILWDGQVFHRDQSCW